VLLAPNGNKHTEWLVIPTTGRRTLSDVECVNRITLHISIHLKGVYGVGFDIKAVYELAKETEK